MAKRPNKRPGDRRISQTSSLGTVKHPKKGADVKVFFRPTTKQIIGNEREGPKERRTGPVERRSETDRRENQFGKIVPLNTYGIQRLVETGWIIRKGFEQPPYLRSYKRAIIVTKEQFYMLKQTRINLYIVAEKDNLVAFVNRRASSRKRRKKRRSTDK